MFIEIVLYEVLSNDGIIFARKKMLKYNNDTTLPQVLYVGKGKNISVYNKRTKLIETPTQL